MVKSGHTFQLNQSLKLPAKQEHKAYDRVRLKHKISSTKSRYKSHFVLYHSTFEFEGDDF